MIEYFKDKQNAIKEYKINLEQNNVVIDKTNLMFLGFILNILEFLSTEDSEKLHEMFEYNILTMRKEFDEVIDNGIINEKAQAVLLTFFLRMAKELEVKYNEISNPDMKELFSIMTSKDFKYPSYIGHQKGFALEKMPANIKRMLHLK